MELEFEPKGLYSIRTNSIMEVKKWKIRRT